MPSSVAMVMVAGLVASGLGFQQVPAGPASQKLADAASRREAVELFRAGSDALAHEKFEQAVSDFSAAVRKDPLFALAFYSLGRAHMFLQQYDKAVTAYEASLDASHTLYDLEQSQRFQVEKLRNEEIQELREVIKRGGRSLTIMALEQHLTDLENQRPSLEQGFRPPAEVSLSLGSALMRLGRTDEAVARWQSAIEVNPKLGEAHNNLAVVYMQTGKLAEAEAEIRAAEASGLKVNPKLKEEVERRKEGK